MSPFLPAVRAHQAVPHPASDVGNLKPSPGARDIILSGRHWNNYFEQGDLDSSLPPVPLVSSGQGPPITTAVQGSSVLNIPVSQGLSPSNSLPTPAFPTLINLSGTSSSSSSSPLTASTTSTTTTTPQSTGVRFPGTRLGSTVLPAMGAVTSPADPNPVLAGATSEARNHPGLSAGAIAAIVIVILLAMGALAFFLLRGRLIQKRTARRATWTANAWGRPTADTSLEKGAAETHPVSLPDERAAPGAASTRGNEGGSAQLQVLIIPRKSPPPYILQTGEDPVTPLRSHSSPVYSSAPSPQLSAVRTVTSESTQEPRALVRVTFVPQLPDELAITPGETVYIRMVFDDGWALCANTRREQGMVPLECLEGGGGQFAELPPPSAKWHNRDSRRVSSLRSPVT